MTPSFSMKARLGQTNAAVLLCCAAVLSAAALLLRNEGQIDRVASSLAQTETAPSSPLPLDYPSRALLIHAIAIGQSLPDGLLSAPDRRRADIARAEVTTVLHRNLDWGETWAIAAFIGFKHDGANNPSTLMAFEKSYRLAPYLRQSAAWRTGFGFAQWEALSLDSRQHVVNEAVWLARVDRRSAGTIFQLARSSDAYADFMLAWLRSRKGDADFTDVK